MLQQYQNIISTMRHYYPHTRSVLVTRIEDVGKLAEVYRQMPCDFVQISAAVSHADKQLFLEKARAIHKEAELFNVLSAQHSERAVTVKEIVGDYVILDKEFAGGTGEQIPKEYVRTLLAGLEHKTVLLAGGMGAVNVREWLRGLHVTGVDVMSALEVSKENKNKDMHKMVSYLRTTWGESFIGPTAFPPDRGLSILSLNVGDNPTYAELLAYDIVEIPYEPTLYLYRLVRRKSQFVPIVFALHDTDEAARMFTSQKAWLWDLENNIYGIKINGQLQLMQDY